jgi:hypothetical protein
MEQENKKNVLEELKNWRIISKKKGNQKLPEKLDHDHLKSRLSFYRLV